MTPKEETRTASHSGAFIDILRHRNKGRPHDVHGLKSSPSLLPVLRILGNLVREGSTRYLQSNEVRISLQPVSHLQRNNSSTSTVILIGINTAFCLISTSTILEREQLIDLPKNISG